ELAARSGLSVRSIQAFEAGRFGRPRPTTVRLLADALELRPPWRGRFIRSWLVRSEGTGGHRNTRKLRSEERLDAGGSPGAVQPREPGADSADGEQDVAAPGDESRQIMGPTPISPASRASNATAVPSHSGPSRTTAAS